MNIKIFLANYASRFTRYVLFLLVFLPVLSAWAGDLTVDNLTVSSNAAVYGNLNFSTVTASTNGSGATASGGNITTNGNYLIHTFTNSGTFQVTGTITCDVLVVAGGGGGGANGGGGGGGGGIVTNNAYEASGSLTVTVGAGGDGTVFSVTESSNGVNSVFGTLTAIGGGGGGSRNTPDIWAGKDGGSGGGGGGFAVGKTPGLGTIGQGNNAGTGYDSGADSSGGGGGGGGAVGANAAANVGGNGGSGIQSSISGESKYYGGGGGGGLTRKSTGGTVGTGGAGGGSNGGNWDQRNATNAIPNTGGGGGGGGSSDWGVQGTGGNGGSGIVIVRYLIPTNYVTPSNIITLTISSNGISQASVSGSNVFMGKVGIGTNNPAEKLHVAGNARIDGTNIVSAIVLGGETRTNWPNVAVGALIASNNLSDVVDKSAARANLGLGTAATNDAVVFLTTNSDGSQLTNITAAQVGALSTNAGALIAANNLSDVANAGTARANLELGSAATNDANAFLSTTGGMVNGASYFIIPAEGISMGSFTNQ